MRPFPAFLAPALAALAIPAAISQAPASPTPDPAATQATLFDRIRAAYYHPGKVALACDATLDFATVMAAIGDAASAKAVEGLKLRVTASDSKPADITFIWPATTPAEARAQVEMGARQVVVGFFQTYWPLANAEVVPKPSDNPKVTGATGGGYTIAAGTGAKATRLSVDASGLIRRVESQTAPGQDATLTLSYTASPTRKAGDLMRFTGIHVDRFAGGMRVQADMQWDDQNVNGVFLPHRVTVSIPGAFAIPVTMSNCTVAPDPGAVTPPQ